MLEIPLVEIPRDSSRIVEVAANAEEIASLFEGVPDFAIVEPENFHARVRLQRIEESVRVAGEVSAMVAFECGRCLEERGVEFVAPMEYLLMPKQAWDEARAAQKDDDDDEDGGYELSAEEMDISFYHGDEIDLRPFLREALLLELPSFAVCPPSIEQACDRDYEANVAPKASAGEPAPEPEGGVDPRWAALDQLRHKDDKKD